jgi:hypothetical protein
MNKLRVYASTRTELTISNDYLLYYHKSIQTRHLYQVEEKTVIKILEIMITTDLKHLFKIVS